MIAWMERELTRAELAVVLVTHDRWGARTSGCSCGGPCAWLGWLCPWRVACGILLCCVSSVAKRRCAPHAAHVHSFSLSHMRTRTLTHTHRYFMENVCDRMLELDGGKAFVHKFGGPGSYEQFREARAARRAAQASAAADARTLERREAEWVVKQPKARQAKSQVGRGVGRCLKGGAGRGVGRGGSGRWVGGWDGAVRW